ncbi:MAG TPA: DUF2800 domain-containing protein [Steroidobacteraceae bacterium]
MSELKSVPVTPDSPTFYADEGTIAHALAAMCLETGKDARAYIGRVIEGEDYPHSDLSPSGAHRWMTCPGSAALERRGEFKPRKFHMEVTAEMADDVQTYVDNIRQFAAHGQLLLEKRVDISHILGHDANGDPRGGTADAIVICANEFQVHDLKFGRGVEVDVASGPIRDWSALPNPNAPGVMLIDGLYYEVNEQLLLYALGVHRLLSVLLDEVPARCRIVIHQPRITQAPKEFDLPVSELLAFGERAQEAVQLVNRVIERNANPDGAFVEELDSYLSAGDHCRFCKAKATCPALIRDVSKTVFDAFDALMNPHETVEPIDVASLDQRRLGAILDKADIIEALLKAAREKGVEDVRAGQPPIGKRGPYKLVAGRKGNRYFTNPEEVEAVLRKARLKKEEIYEFKLRSPKKFETLLKKDRPRVWAKLETLIDQSDGPPHLAPADDPRPPLELPIDSFEATDVETLV